MASQQAPRSEPDAAQNAESLDGFVSVARTRRLEAATAGEQHREVHLISTQGRESRFHGKGARHWRLAVCDGYRFWSSRSNSLVSAAKALRATMFFG